MARTQAKPLSEVNSALFITVASWLRKHGKTVKPTVTEEQKQEFQQCFTLMDGDGSGAIDVRELSNAFKLLGINLTNKEVKELVEQVDRDHTGDIGWAEFLEIMLQTLQHMAEDPQAGDKAYQLPFGLMATQYRRKRYMDSILAGTKEGFSAMVRMAEQHQQQMEGLRGASNTGGTDQRAQSPPRSPRRGSLGATSPRHSRGADDLHRKDDSSHSPSKQPSMMHSHAPERPSTAPAGPSSPAALQPRPHSPQRMSARQARLHALYRTWVQQGQAPPVQRKGGGALVRPQSAGNTLFSKGASETTVKQLLHMPQADLCLSFTRPIVTVPRTVPGSVPMEATPSARPASAAPRSTYTWPYAATASRPGPKSAPRPVSAPAPAFRNLPASQPHQQAGQLQPESSRRRLAESLARCVSSSVRGKLRTALPPRPASACSGAGRVSQPARVQQHTVRLPEPQGGSFLSTKQLLPERSGPLSVRERSWSYADSLR